MVLVVPVVPVVPVVAEVSESASGLHEERPKLKQLLTDARVGVLVVEHTDRLTRFGSSYSSMTTLLEHAGRRVEVVVPTDTETGAGLGDDVVAISTSMAARRDGRRNVPRRAAHLQACAKRCVAQAKDSCVPCASSSARTRSSLT